MRIDQTREHGLTTEVYHLGSRTAFSHQNLGARTDRRNAPTLYGDRLHDAKRGVHGDDPAVLQDQVRICRRSRETEKDGEYDSLHHLFDSRSAHWLKLAARRDVIKSCGTTLSGNTGAHPYSGDGSGSLSQPEAREP